MDKKNQKITIKLFEDFKAGLEKVPGLLEILKGIVAELTVMKHKSTDPTADIVLKEWTISGGNIWITFDEDEIINGEMIIYKNSNKEEQFFMEFKCWSEIDKDKEWEMEIVINDANWSPDGSEIIDIPIDDTNEQLLKDLIIARHNA